MPGFQCQVCGSAFEMPAETIARFPGWTPRFCREHAPRKKARRAAVTGSRSETSLTLAQVLATYSGGPDTGLFTDGSARPNPGPGGWGVVWVVEGVVREERHGSAARTTNNRMELAALIEAFRLLPADAAEVIYTDSKLCVNTITKWAAGWERRGWTRASGEIKNLELVQELYALRTEHPGCKLCWIAAHSGNRWNEYADSLAAAWLRDEL